jgi:hypothetical protein
MMLVQYDYCGMSVNVVLKSDDYVEVNPKGFLAALEDFVDKLGLYDTVDITIKRKHAHEDD